VWCVCGVCGVCVWCVCVTLYLILLFIFVSFLVTHITSVKAIGKSSRDVISCSLFDFLGRAKETHVKPPGG
jgi:hypothetical protein